MNLKTNFRTVIFLFSLFSFSTSLFAQETVDSPDFQEGKAAYQARDYDLALGHFKDSIGDDPSPWEEYEMVGYCYYHLGKLKEAATAFRKSLKLNRNNPGVTDYLIHPEAAPLEPYFGSGQVSQSVSSAVGPGAFRGNVNPSTNIETANPLSDFDLKIPKDAFNFNFYTGYDYSFMTDLMTGLINSANARNNISGIRATETFNQSGVAAGFGIKKAFGAHELSLDFGMVTGASGEVDILDIYGDEGKVILNPTLWSATLNYTYHFESSGDFRPYVTAGGGLYSADVNFVNNYQPVYYATNNSPVTYAQGDFDASTLGGTVGTGFEIMLGKNVTFDMGGHFRVATFGQLLSNNLAGSSVSASQYPYTLMIYQGSLYFTPQSTLTGNSLNGARYAVLDYSGFDVTVGLRIYFGGEPVSPSHKKTASAPNPSPKPNTSSENYGDYNPPIPEDYKPAWNNGAGK